MTAIVDTNVFLDVFLEREPFFQDSKNLLGAVETGSVDGFCCGTTITDIYYILKRTVGDRAALGCVKAVTKTFRCSPVDHAIIVDALESGMRDFEDAILAHSGLRSGAAAIVTRDLEDFSKAPIPSYTPGDFLKIIPTK